MANTLEEKERIMRMPINVDSFERPSFNYSELMVMPITKIKRECLCCGEEMEIYPYEYREFCDRCFPIVCREVFNKANDGMTVEEVKERIRKNIEND